ncbi:MAG: electron transport complex subunit E [Bacteroidales bacterium]|nr:electron transport complex subunit E [Lentimicrobiaceae bacterium]MDD5695346.1 electron transport complex subunit E [Bacteroidales bacterium]
MNQWKNFTKGFIKESPTLVLLLGMCPTLGVSTSAMNGVGMGLATTFVLVMSNLCISAIKNVTPDKVRIPVFITVIAAFVTIVDLVMAGYAPALHKQLGIFIPLIVVNCIVLGRAEAFASKNTIVSSIIDGAGMGLGFTMSITILGCIRELLGNGSIFGLKFIPGDAILIFILQPGAFLTLGFLIALVNRLKKTT